MARTERGGSGALASGWGRRPCAGDLVVRSSMPPPLCSQNVQTLCPYGKTRQIRGACESFPVCELAPGAGFHVTSGKQTQRLRCLLLHDRSPVARFTRLSCSVSTI